MSHTTRPSTRTNITSSPHHRANVTTSLLLWAGVAGAVLWVTMFTTQGMVRPGYDPVRHYVSQLSLGPGGWMQTTNFLATGLFMICFAIGLRRVLTPGRAALWGPILFTSFGVGLIVAGLFEADAGLLGFPPGSVLPADSPTTSFQIHIVAAMVVFFSLPAACFVLARRFHRDPVWRGWTAYSIATGVVVWGLWAASTVLGGDGTGPIDHIAGLIQRIYLIVGFTWIALLAGRLTAFHQAHSTDTRPSPQTTINDSNR